ncbi:hypothetical protein D9M71_728190 [compost metagenome]
MVPEVAIEVRQRAVLEVVGIVHLVASSTCQHRLAARDDVTTCLVQDGIPLPAQQVVPHHFGAALRDGERDATISTLDRLSVGG